VSRIAIIGGGNIGEALLAGLLRSGRQVRDMVVAERVSTRARYLSDTYSVLVADVAEAVENANFVIVAVKPSDVESVTDEIAGAVARDEADTVEHVFVTVVAGVSAAYFETKLPAGAPVIRVMPNAPMVVGAGVSAIAKGRFASNEQLKDVAALFDSVGGVLTVPESQLDAVTAVSGSGPAYFFLIVEALVDAGVAVGLSRAVATDLVVQTIAGSAAMLLERIEEGDAAHVDTTPARLRGHDRGRPGRTRTWRSSRGGPRRGRSRQKPRWPARNYTRVVHEFSTDSLTPVAVTPPVPLFSWVYARVRASGGEATGPGRALGIGLR
jgi:pyrroline-5-carboxylate reductase